MDEQSYREQARHVFLAPGTLEDDPEFRARLTQLAELGLQWGGVLGTIGVFVLIFVDSAVLGRPTSWWYPDVISPETFVLWDKGVVLLACGGAIGLGWRGCSLSVGRWAGAAIAVLIAGVSLVHDAYRGILSVEYVVLVYLLLVVAIPYRPWQAFGIGILLLLLFGGLGHYGVPGTGAEHPELIRAGHLVRMGFTTLVLTGVSALLLSTRYQQHRARQKAADLHQEVAQLERAKSRFFADVSHEFRTPLTILLGSLREGMDGRLGEVPSSLADRLVQMEGQARRMKRLVDQLADLSRVDEGHMEVRLQPTDLVSLTREVLPPVRQWARDKGLSFQVEMDADEIDVWLDPDRYAEILTNVLSNAVKFTPKEGTIRVRIEALDDAAEVSVRDTGPGLPEGLRARVFDREESAIPIGAQSETDTEPERSEQWIGMGIGLAHARALTRRLYGQIFVESESGFGTEITVRLPLGDDHVTEEDRVERDEASAFAVDDASVRNEGRMLSGSDDGTDPPSDAPTVLVVDDEVEMRDYLGSLLGSSYTVETAPNGDEALDTLHDQDVDLVVSDVAMPEADGVSLCEAIRDDEQLQHLPVLLLTAGGPGDTRLEQMRAGADAYVSKPFDPEELEARVENLIEIRTIVQDRVRMPDWLEPKEDAVSSEDSDFLETLNETVDEHIDNSNFGVDWLADEMDLSTRHLRRRLKEVTRLSPAGFIRTRRLQHAAALLKGGADTVSSVASAVGYRDASYFSRLFRETYGCSPTEYADRQDQEPEESDTDD